MCFLFLYSYNTRKTIGYLFILISAVVTQIEDCQLALKNLKPDHFFLTSLCGFKHYRLTLIIQTFVDAVLIATVHF